MRTFVAVLFSLFVSTLAAAGQADPPSPPATGDVQFCFLVASKAPATETSTSVRLQVVKPGTPPFDVRVDFPAATTGAEIAKAFADRLTKAGHTVTRVAGSKCLFVHGVAEYDGRDESGVIEVTFGQSEGVKRMAAPVPRAFKYQGWVEADRWGGLWLSSGVHSVQFAREVEPKVKAFLGKSVEIESHPLVPGSAVRQRLESVETVRPVAPRLNGAATLDLFVGEAKVRSDGTQVIQLRLKYTGAEAIELRQRDFRVLVRRVGDPIPIETTLDLRDRDALVWRADGTSTDVLDDGRGKHDTLWVLRAPGEATCTAKGEYSYGTELLLSGMPQGAYEIWATFEDVNLSKQPGARHTRIAFDVGP